MPAKTDVIRGGYNSIVGIPLLINTFLGKAGPPPYQYYKQFHACSGNMIKSLCMIRFGFSCPGCSPSISELSIS
jgi:hypothetical protein